MKRNKEYLTVAEFAAAAGVSKQYLYKQFNQKSTKLFNYCSTIENKKVIEKSALLEVFGIAYDNQVEQQLNNKNSTVENIENCGGAADDRLIQSLIEQLAEKDRQLKEKDKQIEQLLKLNDQQQQLTLQAQNLLLPSSMQEENTLDEELNAKEREDAVKVFKKIEKESKEKQLEELRAFRHKYEQREKKSIFKKFFK